MTTAKFRKRAIEFYKKAYHNFDEMVHLKGMYLAKRHEESHYNTEEGLEDEEDNDIALVKKRAKKRY